MTKVEIQEAHRWSGSDLEVAITEVGQGRSFPEAILLQGAVRHLGASGRIIADAILEHI